MAILRRLRETLDASGAQYEFLCHESAYTAAETAAAQHLPAREMAKVVMCMSGDPASTGGVPLMAVVPAPWRVHLPTLARVAQVPRLRLATEDEVERLFPDCEPGAMPPFGGLYGIPVWADERLTEDERIVFNAGSHQLSVRMRWQDYARLQAPRIADFAVRHEDG